MCHYDSLGSALNRDWSVDMVKIENGWLACQKFTLTGTQVHV